MSDSKHDLLEWAKLAETAERYEDMVEYMKECVELEAPTEEMERNLLSVAYKNVVGARRSAWRVYAQAEKTEKESKDDKGKDRRLGIIADYKEAVEKELNEKCDEILNLLDTTLIKKAQNMDKADGFIFYQKMKGDYLRYKVEIAEGNGRKDLAEKSEEAYTAAFKRAQGGLEATHPIRLGLALNFSVYYYEIMNQPEKACEMAKTAFDDAIKELDGLQEDRYKDSTLILQLLRDNLTLWTSEVEQDQDDQ